MTSGDAPATTATDVGRSPSRRLLVVVALVAVLHAGAYAVITPAWAVEDEQQHVDYAWKLAHDQRLPTIEDPIDASIVTSIWGSGRWEAYHMVEPSEPTAEAMGLGGRSYLAYHPPLPYLVTAPVLAVTGERALVGLYALRVVSVLATGALAVLTAVLAARLATPARRGDAAAVAGLAVALVPAVADAGGRVEADLVAAVAVAVGVLVLWRWAARPRAATASTAGAVLAVAFLTRETTVVLAVPLVAAVVDVARRGLLRAADLARLTVPGALALAAVLAVSHHATGSVDGAGAFHDRYGAPFDPPPVADAAADLVRRTLVAYGQWTVPFALSVVVLGALAAGLVLAARGGRGTAALVAMGMLVVQLAIMAATVSSGLATVTGRLVLPTLPVLVAVAGAGWAVASRPAVRMVLPAATAVLAVTFLVVDVVPTHL